MLMGTREAFLNEISGPHIQCNDIGILLEIEPHRFGEGKQSISTLQEFSMNSGTLLFPDLYSRFITHRHFKLSKKKFALFIR